MEDVWLILLIWGEFSLYKAITVYSNIIDENLLTLLDYVQKHFELKQREIITLGIVARHRKILATRLSSELQLPGEERLRDWAGRLLEMNLLVSRGAKKGTSYLINPQLLADSQANFKPSLKTIKPYALRALIEECLKENPGSSITHIYNLFRKEIPRDEISRIVYKMVKENALEKHGTGRRNTTYSLAKKR